MRKLHNSPSVWLAFAASFVFAGAASAQFPSLVIDSNQINFTVSQGGPLPALQPRTLTTSSGAALNFTSAVTSSGWLTITPTQGTTPATISFGVGTTLLNPGTYNGMVTFSAAGASNAAAVPVVLTVTPPGVSQVSPSSLTFSYTTGATSPTTQTLSLNATASPQAFTVSSSVPWVTVFPPQGTTSVTATTPITVLANPSGQADGTYSTNLNFTVGGVPFQVPITMQISPAPTLNVETETLRFYYQIGGTAPAMQAKSFGVSSGGSALSFQVAPTGGAWLTATPSIGSTPATVSVQVNATNLPIGDYQGSITVTPTGAGGGAKTVPVMLLVRSQPLLSVNESFLYLAAQFGATSPAAVTITPLSTNTATPLTYTVTATTNKGGAWLSVTPVTNVTPNALSVSVNSQNLTPDTYAGSLVFNVISAGAGNATITIPVYLVVTNEAQLQLSTGSLEFAYQTGRTAPSPWLVNVSSTGASMNYTATAATDSGGNWLSVTPASGATGSDLRIEVVPSVLTTLAAGHYTGTVTVNSPTSVPASQKITVSLWVSSGSLFSLTRSSLNLSAPVGSSIPNPEALTVMSTGDPIEFTAEARIESPQGGGWLILNPTRATTGQPISVFVVPSGLQPGLYRGSIVLTAVTQGVSNSGLAIPVTLRITSGTLTVSPAQLNFTQASGGPAPATQTIQVTSSGAALNWTASASTNIGQNWLSHSTLTGTTPGTITVSVQGTSLPAGTYTGQITIASPGATGSPVNVPVTLTVTAPGTITVDKTSLTFSAQQGGTAPASQTVQVSSTVAGMAITAAAATTTGGNWLTVTPASGSTPATLTIAANPQGLAAGSYTGTVTVTAAGASNSPQRITVTLTVASFPAPTRLAVLNSGSFLLGAVAPGEIVTITGTNLGPTTPVAVEPANNQYPTTRSEVEVTFDNIAAPLLYISEGQINTIVPYEVAGRLTTRIQVKYRGVASEALEQRVTDTAPGIFTLNGSGSGPGAILNQDYSVNTPNSPAAKGSVVAIYATGEGQTFPRGVNGRVTTETTLDSLRRPLGPVSVTIGGQRADVLYAGAAPGLVSGALQVNVRIPDSVGSGQQTVVVTVGAGTSQPGVTVSVQ